MHLEILDFRNRPIFLLAELRDYSGKGTSYPAQPYRDAVFRKFFFQSVNCLTLLDRFLNDAA
jgi:hypothetical protein